MLVNFFWGVLVKCPYCGFEDSKVVDKRESEDTKVIRRRRECLKCAKRFTTFERVSELDILVVKKDGRRESFDRTKLRTGIIKACEKRPVRAEQIEAIVDSIEAEIRKRHESEIATKAIGEMVMKQLKKLDKVAYIRFASVYREFEDIDDFVKAIRSLSQRRQTRNYAKN